MLAPSHTYIPPPDEAVQLGVDDLALRLLRLIVDGGQGHLLARSNVGVSGNWENHAPGAGVDQAFLRALSEAYDWLMVNGLVAVRPGDTGGWCYVTLRGERILDEAEPLATLHAERRIAGDLHHSIAAEVRHQFIAGRYDVAVFVAFREVETRVRDLAGFDQVEHGVGMITHAFRKGGPLADPTPNADRDSMMMFFRGAFAVFRNETGHHRVEYENPVFASEVVMVADLQLRILDQIADRLARDETDPAVSVAGNRFPSLLAHDLATGARLVAGADEVGRACLAGPLVAAACLFDWETLTPVELDRLARLRDSKKLTPARCRELRTVITELAVCVAVCVVTPAEIDRDGLDVSNLRALRKTVSQLEPAPEVCFTDGYAVPAPWGETTKLVRGDATSAAVAAASVIAKARRDELMEAVIAEHPDYGFDRNQGYITPEHNEAIRRHGVTRHHRRSYNCAIYRELGLRPTA